MAIKRRKTRTCMVRDLGIGSEFPLRIQTMTMGKTENIKKCLAEIKTVEREADLIRLAVPNFEAAKAIAEIKKGTSLPLVADIHFDPRLAIAALDYGADKIRINPGNFFDKTYLDKVIDLARRKNAAIRIGVNAGSLEKDLWSKHGAPNADALVESALRWEKYFIDRGFENFIVSLKSSRVPTMIEAYEKFAAASDSPLHLGVTEAGPVFAGSIKSSIGIGSLLAKGIGDTIRVSVLDKITKEVEICKEILKSLGLYGKEPDIVACPTCGRIEVDLDKMLKKVEKELKGLNKPIRVSVMGCVVNAVGEAKESDFAIAGGKKCGALYYKGELYKANVSEKNLVPELLKLIKEKA